LASPADPSGDRSAADDASRGSAIKLGAELLGRLIALATTLMVARILGVADFGLFAVLSGVAVIVAELSDLGIQGIAVQALVSGTIPLRALVRTKLRLTAALVVAAAFLAVAPQVLAAVVAAAPEAWRPSWEALVRRMPLVFPLVVYSALAGWAELLGLALRVRGRRVQEAVTIVTLRASGLALAAAALLSGRGLGGLVWAMALSTLPPVALAAALLSRTTIPASEMEGQAADPGLGRTLKASFPLAVNGGLAILSLRIELFALALLRGSREAGLFAAALKVVELVNMVPAAIAAGAMPALTREAARGAGPVRQRTAATAALLAAPAAAGVILVAPGLVTVLGGGYAPAAGPLRVLAPALLALFMNTVLLHALVAAGRASRLPVLTAFRVAAASVLAVVLIPRLGATGAAAGFLAAELLLLVLAARACDAAGFEVPVGRSLFAALGVTLPMAAAVAIAGAGPAGSIAVGVVTYALTLVLARRWAPRLLPGLAPEAAPGGR
jgi:O-antigen/teichoic acid export membrane protein